MKKVFVLTFVMMMFCAAKAQKGLEDFTYGIKGGWNISNVSNVDYGGIDGKNKMSFHLGFLLMADGRFLGYYRNWFIRDKD